MRNVPFRLTSEIPHCRSLWIGVLRGTWREMGLQYGSRCGKDIRRVFDHYWERQVLAGGSLWQQNRSERERVRYATSYLRRSFQELDRLRPELIEMLEGMAEGAATELDRSQHADACDHFLKVALINYSSTPHFHPHWDFEADRPGTREAQHETGDITDEDGDCNGLWVRGKATRTGHTYAMRTAQSRHIAPGGTARQRQVAYVAVPDDPAARVFWGNGRAGNLGGIGGGLMNDRGVCCLTSGAADPTGSRVEMDAAMAPGIRDFPLASACVIFSDSAREAAEMATVGTAEYRKRTGRSTVFRARGSSIVFADSEDAFCVEQNARQYAVRRPGDLGEKNADYLVHANHFKSTAGLFDEANVFHCDRAMADFAPEQTDPPNSSYFRFWSGMWMLRNACGRIDDAVMREEIAASHVGFNEAGTRFDPDHETGRPSPEVSGPGDRSAWHGTFCAHAGPFTPENPLGVGGNAETTVFDLTDRRVWWVPVWPCHYRERDLDWHCLDLKPFAELRRTVDNA